MGSPIKLSWLTQDYGGRSWCASHRTAHLDLAVFGGSALTDETIDVPDADPGNEQIPVTYVPARNTVFLAYASRGARCYQPTTYSLV